MAFISMGQGAFLSINGPLVFLSLISNIFFAFCLIFPPRNGQRLKQPLRTLLGLLVWSSIIYCIFMCIMYYVYNETHSIAVVTAWFIMLSFVHNSMTCSVWLNFFYYIQIVPSKRALLIWIKRNIRSVIYTALVFGGTLFLFNCAGHVASEITAAHFTLLNGTHIVQYNSVLHILSFVYVIMAKLYILMCLCIMKVSSVSTHRFLQRHIRSLKQGSSTFSSPKINSQMRVAITGICQGVLYFLFDTYNLVEVFINKFSPLYSISGWISFTVTTVYITGTTVNLGIGQSVFRQRMVDIWKTIKALFSVGK